MKKKKANRFLLVTSVLLGLLLVFIFPFNITLRIPTDFIEYSPYVGGLYVNYLVPTLSIIDILVALILGSLLSNFGLDRFRNLSSTTKYLLLGSLLYYVIHNLIFRNTITFFVSTRYLLYFSLVFISADSLKVYKKEISNLWQKRIKIIALSLLFSQILFQGLVGLMQFKRGVSLGIGLLGESTISTVLPGISFVNLQGNVYLRAYGTFPHPNLLAGFFLFSFVIFSWAMYNKVISKVITIVVLVLISAFVLLTFSRVAILLVLFFWILFVLLLREDFIHKKKSNNINSFAFPILIWERFTGILNGSDVSVEDRKGLLTAAYMMIKDVPILGSGIGQFTREMLPYAPTTGAGFTLIQPVHNVFILIIAENGLIFGSFLVVSLLFFQVRSFIFANSRLIALMAISLISVVGFFDHYLLTLPQGLLMFVGLLLVLNGNGLQPIVLRD